MSSQPERVEETEEPQQVISEPVKDTRETLGDSQPEPCTPPNTPVETSQPESTQSQEVPTCDETAMTSESCRRASTQKSEAQPRKDMDFHLGESSETVDLNQQGVSADQPENSPANSQQLELTTQETSLPASQERAVPDSQETVLKECSHLQIMFGKESVLIQSHRTSHADNLDAPSAGQQASPTGSHVRSPSGEQTRDEDPPASSGLDQTVNEGQEMPVTGDQTFDSSERTSAKIGTCRCQKSKVPVIMYVADPSLRGMTFVDDTTGGCSYTIPGVVGGTHGDQKKPAKVKKGKHQERARSTQNKSPGQLVASARRNVCPGEETAPSGEGSQETQMVSGESSVPSPSPLTPRQPPESVSDSAVVQGQGPQEKSDPEDKSPMSPKKPSS